MRGCRRPSTADDSRRAESEPPVVDGRVPLREARKRWVRHFERAYLRDLLRLTDGNVSAAAEIAEVDRVHLHRLLRRTGLRDELVKRQDDTLELDEPADG